MSYTAIQNQQEVQNASHLSYHDVQGVNRAEAKKHVASLALTDSILAAPAQNKMGNQASASAPSIVPPWKEFNGLGGKSDESLISIMGYVLSLQAQSNSRFWSTAWKQASQSMMLEVKFAPIIGDAIISAATAEAGTLNSQAEQSHEEGMSNLLGFGGAVVTGGILEAKDPAENMVDKDPVSFDEEGVTSDKEVDADDSIENDSSSESVEDEKDLQEISDAINNEEGSWGDRAKRTFDTLKEKGGAISKHLAPWMQKTMGATQASQMVSQGVNGIFITAPHQREQAFLKGQEGQAQALNKESDQYSQFYAQSFSRSEDLRNGSQQNIDYAMNVLKSAADGITQTVASLFRG